MAGNAVSETPGNHGVDFGAWTIQRVDVGKHLCWNEGSKNLAQIVNSRCVLAVRDLQLSTSYYVDVLGFSKDPIDAPGWSFLTRDNFRVMLGECKDERPAGELGDHSWFAYWNIEGIDEFYKEIAGRGALVTSQPANKPWGLREFTLRTPDGHRITCGQAITA
nr:hypothetical protein [uncultured bacterium]